MPRISSTGQCAFCGETFSKAVMTRHLVKCQAEHPPKKGKLRETFHLIAQGQYAPEYWLHLEIPIAASLTALDAFLRGIWLECCGHLSAFTVENVRYELQTGGVDAMWPEIFGRGEPPRSMNVRLDSVLRPGLTFYHEYDFGTTTHLALKVVAEQMGVPPSKNAIRVLARNTPPAIPCEKCGAPATEVCTQCIYDGRGWLCEKHSRTHKCGEDMFLPVVNSPRVGMCGYTGPLED